MPRSPNPEPATPGTRVMVTTADGVEHHRELVAGSSYLSTEDPRAHFGLGSAEVAASVRVVWPDGTEVVMHDVEADRIVGVEPA